MPRARVLTRYGGGPGKHLQFTCPGCEEWHMIPVERPEGEEGPTWEWNGDVERPTLSPSILRHPTDPNETRCHSFVRDGRIQFLGDCSHRLAGQTVELPEITERP